MSVPSRSRRGAVDLVPLIIPNLCRKYKTAQRALCPSVARVYTPDAAKSGILALRYERYRALGAFTENLFINR